MQWCDKKVLRAQNENVSLHLTQLFSRSAYSPTVYEKYSNRPPSMLIMEMVWHHHNEMKMRVHYLTVTSICTKLSLIQRPQSAKSLYIWLSDSNFISIRFVYRLWGYILKFSPLSFCQKDGGLYAHEVKRSQHMVNGDVSLAGMERFCLADQYFTH